MAKPSGSGGGQIKGTARNDIISVASKSDLLRNGYDGAGGNDTLDLSALTEGVTIQLPASNPASKSLLYDHAFSGFYTDYYLGGLTGQITGSIKNIENLIGGSGDDYLVVQQGGFSDGGGGNDVVIGKTVIGGSGNDYLVATGNGAVLVGGTYINGVATADHSADIFEIDSASGTILDFELGSDKLTLAGTGPDGNSLAGYSWQAASYNGIDSSVLVTSNQTITLVGITPSDANTIKIGLFLGGYGTLTSGPGDDIIWPLSGASQLIFGSGSGNDIVTHFNIADDTLHFTTAAPTSWTEVSVNGEVAVQGVYDGGASSVTILGLTQADAANLLIG